MTERKRVNKVRDVLFIPHSFLLAWITILNKRL